MPSASLASNVWSSNSGVGSSSASSFYSASGIMCHLMFDSLSMGFSRMVLVILLLIAAYVLLCPRLPWIYKHLNMYHLHHILLQAFPGFTFLPVLGGIYFQNVAMFILEFISPHSRNLCNRIWSSQLGFL